MAKQLRNATECVPLEGPAHQVMRSWPALTNSYGMMGMLSFGQSRSSAFKPAPRGVPIRNRNKVGANTFMAEWLKFNVGRSHQIIANFRMLGRAPDDNRDINT
jgi:hypothetical protein